MTTQTLNEVHPDDLHEWFQTVGINELIEKGTAFHENYLGILAKDEDGEPSEKALQALKSASDFSSTLAVVKVVKNKFDQLYQAESNTD